VLTGWRLCAARGPCRVSADLLHARRTFARAVADGPGTRGS
jgi:hypothetical protein